MNGRPTPLRPSSQANNVGKLELTHAMSLAELTAKGKQVKMQKDFDNILVNTMHELKSTARSGSNSVDMNFSVFCKEAITHAVEIFRNRGYKVVVDVIDPTMITFSW